MKSKIFKYSAIAFIGLAGLVVSGKIIKTNYKALCADFLNHHRGQTQHLINSYIN